MRQATGQHTSGTANNVVIICVGVLVAPTGVPLGSRGSKHTRLRHIEAKKTQC